MPRWAALPSSGPTIGAMPPTAAITFSTGRAGRRGRVDDYGPTDHHGPPTGEAPHEPGPGQHGDGGRQRAHNRRDGHRDDRRWQRDSAAALVRYRPADELAESYADEE